jgi:hypothetical protein
MVPEKPRAMPVATYKRLLEEALQAEMLADEARADWAPTVRGADR